MIYPALIRLINIRLNGGTLIREGSINILVETLIVLVFNTRRFLDAIEKNYPHLLQVMRNFDLPILKLYKSQWEFLRNHLSDDRLDKLFNEGYIQIIADDEDSPNYSSREPITRICGRFLLPLNEIINSLNIPSNSSLINNIGVTEEELNNIFRIIREDPNTDQPDDYYTNQSHNTHIDPYRELLPNVTEDDIDN